MQTFSLWNVDGLKKTIDLGSNWRSPLSSFTDVLFIMSIRKLLSVWFLRKTFLTRIMPNGRNGKMGNTIGSHRERWKSNELHHPSCLIQVSLSMPYLIFSISKNLNQQTEEDPPSVHYINWLKNHGVSQVIRWRSFKSSSNQIQARWRCFQLLSSCTLEQASCWPEINYICAHIQKQTKNLFSPHRLTLNSCVFSPCFLFAILTVLGHCKPTQVL